MSTTTPNLGLFKYNTSTDANSAFNINTALNNNWDIIDTALTNVDALPDQTGKNGYILTTNGSEASWGQTTEIHCVVETYIDGTSWYRVWSDGWCEQGGRGALNETSTTTITLLKAYANANYTVVAVSITASTVGDTEAGLQCTPISASQITLTCHYINPNSQIACWYACGYMEG